jgi:hypothetical protein
LSVDVTHSGEPSTKKIAFARPIAEHERAGFAAHGEMETGASAGGRGRAAAVDRVGREIDRPT